MGELWDVYNRKRELLGKTIERGTNFHLQEGEYRLVVFGFVMDVNNNIFLTQRDPRKQDYALKWECSGGSVVTGEDTLLGVHREVKEESGFDIPMEEFKLIGTDYDEEDHVIVDVFLTILEKIDLNKVILQDGETVDAKVIPFTEFEEMIKNNDISRNVQKCYQQFLKDYYEKNLKK